MDWLARLTTTQRGPIAIALLLLTVAWAAFLPRLQFDFSPRSIFLTWDPELEFLDQHLERFGGRSGNSVVMLRVPEGDWFTRERLEQLQRLTERLEDLDNVERILSLTNAERLIERDGAVELAPFLEELPSTAEELASLREEALGFPLYLSLIHI